MLCVSNMANPANPNCMMPLHLQPLAAEHHSQHLQNPVYTVQRLLFTTRAVDFDMADMALAFMTTTVVHKHVQSQQVPAPCLPC